MKKAIILTIPLFLLIINIAFASHSTNPEDYLYWDNYDRADTYNITNALTGQANFITQGRVNITNNSLRADNNQNPDRVCFNLTNQPGVNPTKSYTVDIYTNLTTTPEGNKDAYSTGFLVYPGGAMCTGPPTGGVKVHGSSQFAYLSASAYTAFSPTLVYQTNITYLIRMFFDEDGNRYNATIYNVSNGGFDELTSTLYRAYSEGATSTSSFLVMDDWSSQNDGYFVLEIAIYNGTTRPQQAAPDVTPPDITYFNLTNENGCENWYSDKNNACSTSSVTPTVQFDTDEPAWCAIAGSSNSTALDKNYTDMGSSRNCTDAASGEGTTNHFCTLKNQDELVYETSYLFISCKDASNNTNRTSTSGALKLSITSLESNAKNSIGIGIQNALLSGYTNYTDLQIYARNLANSQVKGTFDRAAKKGSKMWAFNRIGISDNHVNMFNLTPVLYVMEFANLTSTNLTNQTQRLIEATK